jgi:hypothetical protein
MASIEVLWAQGRTVRGPRPIAHAFLVAAANRTAHGYDWSDRSVCERATRGASAGPEARRCRDCEGALVRIRWAASIRGSGNQDGR